MAKKLTPEQKQYNKDIRVYHRRQKHVIEADALLLAEAELSLKYCQERAKLLRQQIAHIKKTQ